MLIASHGCHQSGCDQLSEATTIVPVVPQVLGASQAIGPAISVMPQQWTDNCTKQKYLALVKGAIDLDFAVSLRGETMMPNCAMPLL